MIYFRLPMTLQYRRYRTRIGQRSAAAFTVAIFTVAITALACAGDIQPDAYGNFESTEVIVSSEIGGQVLLLEAVEGERLGRGALAAVIDTSQLVLQRDQFLAQRAASGARRSEVAAQLRVVEAQREISERGYERTRRLFDQRAATAPQLDMAERDYRTLVAQEAALRAQSRTARADAEAADARVAQIDERLARSRIVNPQPGTVLTTYTHVGEVVQPGQPLYRIADLDTLDLRAYVSGDQLTTVRLGGRVTVHVGSGDERRDLPGVVGWVSSTAEFTPTPIQTRDERADLVYAVRIRVPNHDGSLKIGMPADVTLAGRSAGAPVDSLPTRP